MRSYRLICLFGAVLAAASTAAGAQNAFTAHTLNLRTGPDRAYPPVTLLAPGTPVQIQGCLSDWSWCDVIVDDSRGWAYAPGLTYVYQGARVPFYTYAPSFGIPFVTFSLGTYWDRYYRGKPWYSQRTIWLRRKLPPHRRPTGPPPHAGPPPRAGARPGTNAHLPMAPPNRTEGRRPETGRPGTAQPGNGRGEQPQRGQPQRGQPQRGQPQRGQPQRSNSSAERRSDSTQDNPR